MMPIVWGTTVLDAGAARTITQGRSSFQEFICRKSQKSGKNSDKGKTQKYIQLYLPKEDIFTKMAF